jgi:vancomycin resistance protein YoaR
MRRFALVLAATCALALAAANAAVAATADSGTISVASFENEFPVTLGTFATTLIGSRIERTDNIRLAAEALHGVTLGPGEVLSFNAVVGPRTVARGYRPAPVILRETRQLQTGGGICQVSSTLLAAGLLSGLSIVERHRHSTPVDYIGLGEDATISWGVKDLKLRNDLAQRVRLVVEVVGSTLAVRVEGQDPLADSFELITEEREIPGDPSADSLPGREIDVYRIRLSGGQEVDREFLYRDRYAPARRPE